MLGPGELGHVPASLADDDLGSEPSDPGNGVEALSSPYPLTGGQQGFVSHDLPESGTGGRSPDDHGAAPVRSLSSRISRCRRSARMRPALRSTLASAVRAAMERAPRYPRAQRGVHPDAGRAAAPGGEQPRLGRRPPQPGAAEGPDPSGPQPGCRAVLANNVCQCPRTATRTAPGKEAVCCGGVDGTWVVSGCCRRRGGRSSTAAGNSPRWWGRRGGWCSAGPASGGFRRCRRRGPGCRRWW